MSKQNIHSYPKTAYICFFIFNETGKPKDIMPNPEIFSSLEEIKTMVNSFNLAMKESGNQIVILNGVGINRLDLLSELPYIENKWNDPKSIITNAEVLVSCLKLQEQDNPNYKLLVAPCKDYKGTSLNTIQSIYSSPNNNVDWETLRHSDRQIVKGTKHIALYKCGPPELYAVDKDAVAGISFKGKEVKLKNLRKV